MLSVSYRQGCIDSTLLLWHTSIPPRQILPCLNKNTVPEIGGPPDFQYGFF